MTHHEDSAGYRCLLEGPFHLDDDCPIGRAVPPELRVFDQGAVEMCRTCVARREARAQTWGAENRRAG